MYITDFVNLIEIPAYVHLAVLSTKYYILRFVLQFMHIKNNFSVVI